MDSRNEKIGYMIREARQIDRVPYMLIIGGTSLAVYPAAGFLRYFKGDNIVLINRDETQYDEMATLVFRDSIGEVLSKTLNAVKAE